MSVSSHPNDESAESGGKQTRRYINTLFLLQAIGASSPPIIISLGGLVGETLSSDKTLATLPVSLFNIGLALSVLPVGFLISRFGRTTTYTLGTGFAFIGGIIACLGLINASFILFCFGTALAGCYAACVQSYRFAVTDYIPKSEQPKAISRVMLGGLLAAIIGPQMVVWSQDLLPVPLSASFLSQSLLALLAFCILFYMRRVMRQLTLPEDAVTSSIAAGAGEAPRSLGQIVGSFHFISIIVAALVSYGLMTFMMTATPMAMMHAGHTLSATTLGIQWHILAMYAPSFFTGRLMKRFGERNVCASGLILTALAALLSMTGTGILPFWSGLIVLGIGWNFGFLGATAMVAAQFRHSERIKVQSLNDFLVFGTTATASLLSGKLLHTVGWFQLNMAVFFPVAVALLLLFLQKMREERSIKV